MPASIVADWFINKYLLPWPAYIGIGLVIASFVMLNIAEYLSEKEEEERKNLQREEEEDHVERLLSADSAQGSLLTA